MVVEGQGQRRFRDKQEREAIRAEATAAMRQLGDLPAVRRVTEELDRFVAREGGGVQQGVAPAPELGPGVGISFCLPGRRVQRHFVRIDAAKAARSSD